MTPEQQYCRSLIESAETAEDLRAAQELFRELMRPEASKKAEQKAPPAAGPDEWMFKSLPEVASFFGVSPQAAKQWRQEDPPLPGDEKGYPAKACVRWRERKLQRTEAIDQRRQLEIELANIKLENERLDLAERNRQILAVGDVERWAGVALSECREGIMQLPGRIASAVPPELREEIRKTVAEHCAAVLEATCRRLEMAELGTEWNPDGDE